MAILKWRFQGTKITFDLRSFSIPNNFFCFGIAVAFQRSTWPRLFELFYSRGGGDFLQDLGGRQSKGLHVVKQIPSRELTYPTLGKRNIIFKMPFLGDMLVPWRVPSRKLNVAPENYQNPIGKDRHRIVFQPPFFQGRAVKLRGGVHYLKLTYHVDGEKSGGHQLRLIVYTNIYKGIYNESQVVVWDFFHQR